VDLNVGASGATTLLVPGNNLSVTTQHVGFNGSGAFTQTGGVVDVGDAAFLGTNFGSNGALTVSGPTASFDSNWLSTGYHGDGTLTIEDGGSVSVLNKTGLGEQTNGVGTAVVTGASSTLNAMGWMDVGSYGHGTLTVEDHGRVTGGGVYIGGGPSGFGQLYVDGAGSILDPGFMAVGAQGQGELIVRNSGIAMAQNGIVIGGNVGGVGSATVSGAGSEFHATWYLAVGAEGYGSLLVEDGAVAEADNSFTIGAQATGSGDAHVTGTGSRLEGAWNVLVGEHGEGELTVDSGGVVTSPGWLITGLHPGSDGTLHVGPGGTARTDQQVQIADLADSTGDVVVSGLDASLEATWWINVGNQGQGTLTVENGATAEAEGGVVIGDLANGVGEATVRGVASSFVAAWEMVVADEGRGTLTVSDGASAAALHAFEIGRAAGSVGEVTVSGVNSNVSGVWYVAVGNVGEGTLHAEGGGTVSTPGDFDVASNPDSKGVVNINNGGTVSTSGSSHIGGWWAAAGGQGVVNVNAGGTYNVTNSLMIWNVAGNVLNLRGGTINAGGLNFNGNPSLFNWSSGTLHITSSVTFDPAAAPDTTSAAFGSARTIAGSRKLKITGSETLGGVGGFGLTVTTGGVHEVTGTLSINSNGAVHLHNGGTVTADTIQHTSGGTFSFIGGTLHVETFNGSLNNSGGTLAPGTSPGMTTVNGNYIQNAGTLQIEIGPSAYDKVMVNGNVTFGGTLQVLLLDDYSPAQGAEFNILDWTGTRSGNFALSLPALQGSLTWDTSELNLSGVLSVISGSEQLGDENKDGFVDAADYIAWRKLNGANEPAYVVWRQHFGEPSSGGSPSRDWDSSRTGVPEPCSMVMLLVGLLGTLPVRRSFRA
jgi:T5SS/PEP-CTERM-associated repeat protein